MAGLDRLSQHLRACTGPGLFFAVCDLCLAALVCVGVFSALPLRWWPVDLAAAGIAAGLVASATGLLACTRWSRRVARLVAAALLLVGLVAILALGLSAGYLSGTYGSVGRGGALVFLFVIALLLPYFVVLPAAQMVWFAKRQTAEAAPEVIEVTIAASDGDLAERQRETDPPCPATKRSGWP